MIATEYDKGASRRYAPGQRGSGWIFPANLCMVLLNGLPCLGAAINQRGE